MSGWIKIHRQIIEWEWFTDTNTFRVFLQLLLKANHKEKKYRGMVLKVGTIITSRDILALETRLSVQQVRTSLDKLKSTNEITIKTSSQGTIIEVVNYEKYQLATNEVTNKQPINNQQVTTNKNEKNNKENIYREFQHLFITEDEVKKLLDKHTITQINNVLNDIENYKQNTKYKSLYLTAVKWLQKNEPTSEGISPEEIKARKYGYIN
jgi:DNA-binding helix-hairpin-helix protein with protein kinase domain